MTHSRINALSARPPPGAGLPSGGALFSGNETTFACSVMASSFLVCDDTPRREAAQIHAIYEIGHRQPASRAVGGKSRPVVCAAGRGAYIAPELGCVQVKARENSCRTNLQTVC